MCGREHIYTTVQMFNTTKLPNGALIRDHIENTRASITSITETWNRNEDSDYLFANTAPEGFFGRILIV